MRTLDEILILRMSKYLTHELFLDGLQGGLNRGDGLVQFCLRRGQRGFLSRCTGHVGGGDLGSSGGDFGTAREVLCHFNQHINVVDNLSTARGSPDQSSGGVTCQSLHLHQG